MFLEGRPRCRDTFKHLAEDIGTALASLFKCLFKDLTVDAVNLDIHLDGRNAFFRTGNLEVHITIGVFKALNIRQDGNIIPFLDKAHGHTGNKEP